VGTLVVSAVAQPTEASDVSSQLRGIASAGQLPELRWPNFSDYREHVQNFYQPSNYTPACVLRSLVVFNGRWKILQPRPDPAHRGQQMVIVRSLL
jgi:hypothetical protein